MTTPTLLIIGAGPDQTPAIIQAKELGYRVAAIDRDPQAAGRRFADEFAAISTADAAGALEFARQVRAGGVLTLISETGVPVAAAVAEALGLPGISRHTAHLATNKNAMRRAFQAAGVATPRSQPVRTADEVKDFAQSTGFPIVIKPSDCSGQSGTAILEHEGDIPAFLAAALRHATDAWAIVEEYVPGPEINVTAVVNGGEVHILSLSDRVTAAPPHFGIAIRHVAPPALTPAQQEDVRQVAAAAACAIGMRDGIAYPQVIVGPRGARVIEIAARIPGGYMREVAMLTSGIDLIRVAIAQAMGEPVDLAGFEQHPRHPAVVVDFITELDLPPATRQLRQVEGLDRARRLPGIYAAALSLSPGDAVPRLDSSRARFGAVIGYGQDREAALATVGAAKQSITLA